MRKMLLCVSLLMRAVSSSADESFPRDVQRFIDRREGCDHMRGEVPGPGEKQRVQEVDREIQKLCHGTDRELVRLKKQYAKNPSVMGRLDGFESAIEVGPVPVSRSRAGHGSR